MDLLVSHSVSPVGGTMSDSHSIDSRTHVRKYLYVFYSLMVLTVVTVSVSYVHLPFIAALTVALIIASIKAALVAGYFMHLISERKMIYAILVLTVVFFVALMFLPMLHHSDPGMVG